MRAATTDRVVAIVQARMGSTRLPGKVMMPLGGVPLIGVLLGRLEPSNRLNDIVLATSETADNDVLAAYVRQLGYTVFRGSESDVLDRYYQAAAKAAAARIVRITADCPLIEPAIVDAVVAAQSTHDVDYASNIDPPTYPDGLDVEAFSFGALKRAWEHAIAGPHREHVTMFIRESPDVTRVNVRNSEDLSTERWTVDNPEDAEVIRQIFAYFEPRRDFSWTEVLALREARPELFNANRHYARNYMSRAQATERTRK